MMMSKDILYLGSQSRARQRLLDYAGIRYKVLTHQSSEECEQQNKPFDEYVLAIAQSKMQALVLPPRTEIDTDYLFVVTADTLVRNPRTDQVLAKPNDRQHAIAMLTEERGGPIEVMTGCCLEKFQYINGSWSVTDKAHWAMSAMVEFYVDKESVNRYLEIFPFALHCSGAGVVEDHGLSYLKSVQGSYTAVIGLPLYELRQKLASMKFRF